MLVQNHSSYLCEPTHPVLGVQLNGLVGHMTAYHHHDLNRC